MQDDHRGTGQKSTEPFDEKMIAFLLSLVVPGAGQIWKGHSSAVWWLLGAALTMAICQLAAANIETFPRWAEYVVYAIYCLAAGWHAVQCRAVW